MRPTPTKPRSAILEISLRRALRPRRLQSLSLR
jgi:hypothetical protein